MCANFGRFLQLPCGARGIFRRWLLVFFSGKIPGVHSGSVLVGSRGHYRRFMRAFGGGFGHFRRLMRAFGGCFGRVLSSLSANAGWL